MIESEYVTYAVEDGIVTLCVTEDQPTIHVLDAQQGTSIVVQESLADISFPIQQDIVQPSPKKTLGAMAGVYILPLEGGGRGPIINYGEAITLGLLLSELADSLDEDQFSALLNARMDSWDAQFLALSDAASFRETGYATHDDVILLANTWVGKLPTISLSHSHGISLAQVQTLVSGITRITIPEQEMIYGHSGLTAGNTFTIKAGLLVKEAPTVVPLAWTPANITAPPTTLTTESPVTNTTANCMQLRIQGTLGLQSTSTDPVAGRMSVQMSIDGGAWITITEFYKRFNAGGSSLVSQPFDVLLAYDQAAHAYKFRGQLVADAGEVTRELTGSILIAKVTESGTGAVLSNDLQLKWSVKE